MKYRSLYFKDKLRILDQVLLPTKIEYVECGSHLEVYSAIKNLKVRGAPAIGIAAAYGMALSIDNLVKANGCDVTNWDDALFALSAVADFLNEARPTAVNINWATSRMLRSVREWALTHAFDIVTLRKSMLEWAECICEEDVIACTEIGEFGAALIKNGMQILTHCNAGSLATAGLGTALAPLYIAHRNGKKFNVYVDETRPVLQGSRLTAWELHQSGLEPVLITDNCAAYLMSQKRIDMVIVGADRITKIGDVANKIGTYGLAVLCDYHKIPFYVAAPVSSFDMNIRNGQDIPIEIRDPAEVTTIAGQQLAPTGVFVYNPAFDITPAALITGIITDHGIINPVNEDKVEKCFAF